MDNATFDQFRTIVYEKSGIAISSNKVSLVMARVGKRMRELSIDNASDYLSMLLSDEQDNEIIHLLDCISTNVTSFFRESEHFDIFGQLIREWAHKGQTRFRFWSAASSSGEEPYSMAMTALDAIGGSENDIKILATDLSTRVLEKCAAGEYSEKHIAAVPPSFRIRFFDSSGHGDNARYLVKERLKKTIAFARLNLSQAPYPMKGPFDAIFLRNVMIYFDNPVRKRLLEECYRLLRWDGYLFVGHAETLTGIISAFKPIGKSVFVKKD